jgi:hypothetical protein
MEQLKMQDKKSISDIIGTMLFICFIIILILLLLQPILVFGFKIGLPDTELYKVGITKDNTEELNIQGDVSYFYCTNITETTDLDSGKVNNKVVIADNPHEAKIYHYVKTVNKKSFFGYFISHIERVNVRDEYFIIIKQEIK